MKIPPGADEPGCWQTRWPGAAFGGEHGDSLHQVLSPDTNIAPSINTELFIISGTRPHQLLHSRRPGGLGPLGQSSRSQGRAAVSLYRFDKSRWEERRHRLQRPVGTQEKSKLRRGCLPLVARQDSIPSNNPAALRRDFRIRVPEERALWVASSTVKGARPRPTGFWADDHLRHELHPCATPLHTVAKPFDLSRK